MAEGLGATIRGARCYSPRPHFESSRGNSPGSVSEVVAKWYSTMRRRTDAPVFLASVRTIAILGAVGVVKKSKEPDVVSAARALINLRWSKIPVEKRAEELRPAVEAAAKKRRSEPKSVRKARAVKAAKAISPEAAKARALKAWETKRRKAELKNAG